MLLDVHKKLYNSKKKWYRMKEQVWCAPHSYLRPLHFGTTAELKQKRILLVVPAFFPHNTTTKTKWSADTLPNCSRRQR